MSSPKTQVYVLLGAAGSGRREIVTDLIEGGLSPDDRPVVLLSAEEQAAPQDSAFATLARWQWQDGALVAAVPAGAGPVFFVTDGRANPVDQIEALKPWLESWGGEVARVLCVVNCQLAERHPELLAWYEACIHFSDIVLLNRREGVANKWLSDFQTHFKDRFYPALFEFVKQGRVRNPAVALLPEARRMSHFFDDPALAGFTLQDVEVGVDDEEEPIEVGDDEDDGLAEVDPYLERRLGGRRAREIPDIRSKLE
jgi:hypothetical protein